MRNKHTKNLLFNDLQVLGLFFIIAIAFRFFSFFPSLIDHDESTYLVIAKDILKGKVLYKDVTDIKPVGIFYLLAGYLKIFGDSIFVFRMFGAFVIASTSLLIYKAKVGIGHSHGVAIRSGVIYIVFLSIWTFYGVPINTEHFFNFFTALALFILVKERSVLKLCLMSFIMGLGFLIKIMVAFDFAAFLLFLLIVEIKKQGFSPKMLVRYVQYGLAFLLPFVLVNFAFWATGNYAEFFQVNFVTFRNYPADHNWLTLFVWIVEFFARFLPISIFYFIVLFNKDKIKDVQFNERIFVAIWTLFVLISILLPGKTFRHYTIQLMLPIAFLAGNIFSSEISKPKFVQFIIRKPIGYILMGIFLIANTFLQKKDFYDKPDFPREISSYIKKYIKQGDVVYTGNTGQIIYYLLDASPPTKYVHSSLLFAPIHYNALEIDPDKEFEKILEHKPRFILEKTGKSNKVLTHAISSDYTVLKYFEEYLITLYIRKE